mmetsp:Transcript_20847/g.60685  ORF Transcript_20847/g.60685 Transcript_20847/m.60685 type:complete len:422 (-) Transcript_20847:564-1829(-)
MPADVAAAAAVVDRTIVAPVVAVVVVLVPDGPRNLARRRRRRRLRLRRIAAERRRTIANPPTDRDGRRSMAEASGVRPFLSESRDHLRFVRVQESTRRGRSHHARVLPHHRMESMLLRRIRRPLLHGGPSHRSAPRRYGVRRVAVRHTIEASDAGLHYIGVAPGIATGVPYQHFVQSMAGGTEGLGSGRDGLPRFDAHGVGVDRSEGRRAKRGGRRRGVGPKSASRKGGRAAEARNGDVGRPPRPPEAHLRTVGSERRLRRRGDGRIGGRRRQRSAVGGGEDPEREAQAVPCVVRPSQSRASPPQSGGDASYTDGPGRLIDQPGGDRMRTTVHDAGTVELHPSHGAIPDIVAVDAPPRAVRFVRVQLESHRDDTDGRGIVVPVLRHRGDCGVVGGAVQYIAPRSADGGFEAGRRGRVGVGV